MAFGRSKDREMMGGYDLMVACVVRELVCAADGQTSDG